MIALAVGLDDSGARRAPAAKYAAVVGVVSALCLVIGNRYVAVWVLRVNKAITAFLILIVGVALGFRQIDNATSFFPALTIFMLANGLAFVVVDYHEYTERRAANKVAQGRHASLR